MPCILSKLLTVIVVGVFVVVVNAVDAEWPLHGEIDISSGFGDYRPGHFHFGVDLRTGGAIGRQVFSPVDGYVSRIKTSYTGYGKALYISDESGRVYVMAHLSKFADKIDSLVKKVQIESERYYVDISLPWDSFPVEQGEFVAYSGKTGTGAPHLHFETRLGDTLLNPLSHGMFIDDETHPVFTRIGFQFKGGRSLFPDGSRKLFLDVAPTTDGAGRFELDTVLYLDNPFGVIVDTYDRMRLSGMKQTVYSLSLYIDEERYYHVQFDTLDFETNDMVSLEYDYVEAVNKKKHVRQLYKKTGNVFAGSRSSGTDSGLFGLGGHEEIGPHEGRVVAEDAFGNRSELCFSFIFGRPHAIYGVDSTVEVAADTTLFYLSPKQDYRALGIDSLTVHLNKGSIWGESPDISVSRLDSGRYVVEAIGYMVESAVMRPVLYTSTGAKIQDHIFNGLLKKGSSKGTVSHEVLDEGLLVVLENEAAKGSESRLELYWRDTLLGIEQPQYVHMNKYVCFIPPQDGYARIDQFKFMMAEDTAIKVGVVSDSVNIAAVGFNEREEVRFDDRWTLVTGQESFYEPRFIELRWQSIFNRAALKLNSDHYEILPEAFVSRSEFAISYDIPWDIPDNERSGICWLDEEKDKWVWLDNTFEDNSLQAYSLGGGSFAAAFDRQPPLIKNLTIRGGARYRDPRPAVNFLIDEELSGIEDDRSIRIKIDGKWLIPEYDPETGWCTSRPLEPLDVGSHHLGIVVTDRAGNVGEQYLNFVVSSR